jgi:Domain of unknown function (DUF5664)
MKAGDKVYIKNDDGIAYGVRCGDSGIVEYVDGYFACVRFGHIQLHVLPSELDLEQDEPVMSQRFNSGKVQLREVNPEFVLGLGQVLTASREKYAEGNWMNETKYSTPYESCMRHIAKFWSGEEIDNETLQHHLLHAATNLMFLHYHLTSGKGIDDRLFKKDKK